MKIYIEKRKSKNGMLYTRAYYESTSPDGSKCFHNTITFDKWAIGAMLGGISEYYKMKEGDVYEVQLDTCYRVVSEAESEELPL